jgi:small subunit ribosomal protein S4
VNGKPVNIPSYRVRTGEIVAIKENKKQKGLVQGLSERLGKQDVPAWLNLNASDLSGKVSGEPKGDDLRSVFDPTMIVEFYSR